MKELALTNIVQTICGQTYVIDFLDQVALGIFEPEKFTETSTFIPGTFSLYKTAASNFILETTRYHNPTQRLETTYRLIPEAEARPFIESGGSNIFLN
jgi:hypothetical protein